MQKDSQSNDKLEIGSGCRLEYYDSFGVSLVYTEHQADSWYSNTETDVPIDEKKASEIIAWLREKYHRKYKMDNGSTIAISNSDDKITGVSDNLLELNGIETDSNSNVLRQKRLAEGLTNIKLEQDLRILWGDLLVESLLEIMSFKELLKWIDEPNEFLDNRTPKEVARVDGLEHIEELIENHYQNGHSHTKNR